MSTRHNLVSVWAELAADYETPLAGIPEDCCALASTRSSSNQRRTPRFPGAIRFSAPNPRAVFEARGRIVRLIEGDTAREFEAADDPLRELERFMGRFRPAPAPALPIFRGGAVGFLSYDAVRYFEPTVPPPPGDDLGLPEMSFMIADTVIIFDHRYRLMQVVANVCLDDFPSVEAAYAAARRSDRRPHPSA